MASSRTLDFEDSVSWPATAGRGVDVVLNSLAGSSSTPRCELSPAGGRFIEMGKTDIRDPDTGAPPPIPAWRYRAYDLYDLVEAGPSGSRRC